MVAHRGASATEPENTLRSFETAVSVGADAVEFDVRLTADGHAVVMHDATVDRTTDGSGLVRSMTLAALQRLRIVGSDLRVPTLDETLRSLSGRMAVDIEIKNIPGEPDFDAQDEPAVAATLAALHRTAFVGPVMVSSFNPLSIALARASEPDLPTGLLTIEEIEAPVALAFAREHGHPWVLPAAARVMAAGDAVCVQAHESGMRVGTWVVDDPARGVAMFLGGVDAVATNDPAALAEAWRSHGAG